MEKGDQQTVKLLLENGADINVVDYCGYNVCATVADNLSDEQGAELLRYLIENGAVTHITTNFDQDCYFLAIRDPSRDSDEIARIINSNT